jgi:putative sigma-54 modulation protein
MQIKITGRNVEITDGIRDHIYEKLEHALTPFPRVEMVHVVLELEKYRHFAELVVQGNHIHVEGKAESDDMYISLDDAIAKAEKQLRKLRDKVQDHHRSHGKGLGEIEAGT